MDNVDPADAGILYLLRNDARNRTTAEIGNALDLAPSTVGTRINDLEAKEVICGYEPRSDYDKLGFGHQFVIAGTAPFENRQDIARKLTEIRTVVNVRGMMTTEINVAVKIVGSSRKSVEQSLEELQDQGLSINRIEKLETEHNQPVNIFGNFVSNDLR